MSYGEHLSQPEDRDYEVVDVRLPQTLAVGLLAALAGGAAWGVIVRFTHYEVGYMAWGIGLLVGVAMTRVTPHRSKTLGAAAASLAVLGLLFGKVFIFASSAGPIASNILESAESLEAAMARQMYVARELEPATLDSLDARFAAQDTLSDALWTQVRQQASARLQAMNDEEKASLARTAATQSLQEMGLVGGVMTQFSGFDLLWFFLAIGTAHRMMAQSKVVEAVPQEEEAPPAP